ncbi:hypothetical protein ACLOAV_007076 [Pseudogymnoascus australis]
MSRSPKKRKTNPPTAPSDALSEYSLPTPSDRVRASSPPRELREIYKYAQPPIRFLTTPDEHTPKTVLELYKNLQEASSAAAIPAIFKARIHDTYPYQSIPSSAFVPTEQTLQSSEVESTWKLAASLLSKARQAFEGNEPEGSWIRLASEVLDGVFEGSELKLLRTMDVQYSDINSATLLPTVNDIAIPVKKADLAVAIHSAKPAASMIYESIRKQNPAMKLSQMQDASVSRMALPICVEVGEPGKSYNEASIQLGVWCCAGLLKLHELRLQQGDIDTEETVPLIGMTAIGLDWKSHVAYKLPDDGAVTPEAYHNDAHHNVEAVRALRSDPHDHGRRIPKELSCDDTYFTFGCIVLQRVRTAPAVLPGNLLKIHSQDLPSFLYANKRCLSSGDHSLYFLLFERPTLSSLEYLSPSLPLLRSPSPKPSTSDLLDADHRLYFLVSERPSSSSLELLPKP